MWEKNFLTITLMSRRRRSVEIHVQKGEVRKQGRLDGRKEGNHHHQAGGVGRRTLLMVVVSTSLSPSPSTSDDRQKCMRI